MDVLVNNAAVQVNWREPIRDPKGHDDRTPLFPAPSFGGRLMCSRSGRETDLGWSRGVSVGYTKRNLTD